MTADIDATVQADYIQTTGDKVSYDVSGAKSVVTLKYVDMGALAKKPGDSNPLVDHKFGADPYAVSYTHLALFGLWFHCHSSFRFEPL